MAYQGKRHILPPGSVYYSQRDARWIACLSLGSGKRVTRSSKTEHAAQLALRQLKRENGWPVRSLRTEPLRQSLRPVARDWTLRLIEQSRLEGWTDDHLASAIVAVLATKRVRYGIFGPCAYCGTWIANSVDHVIPLSRGGEDGADNVVSACQKCNHEKRDRTPDEWRAA